jgi:hypothetical protein
MAWKAILKNGVYFQRQEGVSGEQQEALLRMYMLGSAPDHGNEKSLFSEWVFFESSVEAWIRKRSVELKSWWESVNIIDYFVSLKVF